MLSVNTEGKQNTYYCLSTDAKPADAPNGSMLFEMDTKKVYLFDKENKRWLEQ